MLNRSEIGRSIELFAPDRSLGKHLRVFWFLLSVTWLPLPLAWSHVVKLGMSSGSRLENTLWPCFRGVPRHAPSPEVTWCLPLHHATSSRRLPRPCFLCPRSFRTCKSKKRASRRAVSPVSEILCASHPRGSLDCRRETKRRKRNRKIRPSTIAFLSVDMSTKPAKGGEGDRTT